MIGKGRGGKNTTQQCATALSKRSKTAACAV